MESEISEAQALNAVNYLEALAFEAIFSIAKDNGYNSEVCQYNILMRDGAIATLRKYIDQMETIARKQNGE